MKDLKMLDEIIKLVKNITGANARDNGYVDYLHRLRNDLKQLNTAYKMQSADWTQCNKNNEELRKENQQLKAENEQLKANIYMLSGKAYLIQEKSIIEKNNSRVCFVGESNIDKSTVNCESGKIRFICGECLFEFNGITTTFLRKIITNREWLNGLSNEEFAKHIINQLSYDETKKQLIEWLSAERED